MAAFVVTKPRMLEQLELVGYDQLLAAVPERARSAEVVIVDIDERSLEELGQWPWPRSQVAELLDRMVEAGAASIGVDFLFQEPDRLSLRRIKEYMESSLDASLDLDHLPLDYLDLDLVLAESVVAPEIVTGVLFSFEPPEDDAPIPVPVFGAALRSAPGAPEAPLPRALRATFPVAPVAAATSTSGFVNAFTDIDGAIRRAPLLFRYQDRIFPSLALAAVMRARGVETVVGEVSQAGVDEIRAGEITVPTDHQGGMLLPFAKDSQSRFTSISATDLLAGRTAFEELAGKIIFFGSSAVGLKDTHSTPFDRALPGLQVHATTAATLIEGDFLHLPAWSLGAQVLAVLLAALTMAAVHSRFRITFCVLAAIGILGLMWLGARWLLVHQGIYISPVAPMLTVALTGSLLGSTRSRMEEKRALASVRALAAAQDCAILGLVSVAETRDPETGFHILRTQRYVQILAENLATRRELSEDLSDEKVQNICRGAPLHDIGKVGVPDQILLKPERLTEEEYELMKTHTVLGYDVLTRADETSGVDHSNSFLRHAAEIARTHHEKWDGSGYPQGLAGKEIPLAARIMAVADVYDAIRSQRHYKPARTHDEARDLIVKESGAHFDPLVVEAFLEIEQAFAEIADEYVDEKQQPPEHS